MGITEGANPFDQFSEKTPIESPSEVEDGSLGSTLDIWSSTRENKLTKLVTASITNESSFIIPKAVVSTGGFDVGWGSGEKFAGKSVFGMMLRQDGSPLSGTAMMVLSENNSVEKTVTGTFIMSAPPSQGVISGVFTTPTGIDFQFTPSINGISYTSSNIPSTEKIGTIQYGEISGKITKFDGTPAKNVSVSGPGSADVTGEDGTYILTAPGGTSTTLTTLNGTYDFGVTLSPGEEIVQDVTFPSLIIRVLDADLEPVENSPVEIDGDTFYTDAGGKVKLDKAEVRDYHVKVMDFYDSESVSVGSAGEEWVYTVGPGASFGDYINMQPGTFRARVVDDKNGEGVENADCRILDDGTLSHTGEGGKARVLSPGKDWPKEVEICGNDRRYENEVLEYDPSDYDSGEVNIRVGRSKNNQTY